MVPMMGRIFIATAAQQSARILSRNGMVVTIVPPAGVEVVFANAPR